MNTTFEKRMKKEEAAAKVKIGNFNGLIDSVPIGFRFVPDDRQLVKDYLVKKAKNLPIFDGFIQDYNVYSTEPWNLPNEEFKYGVGNEAYYFTKRSNKNGTWVENGEGKPIKDGKGKVVGHVTRSSFHRLNDKASSNWVMDEYTTTDTECQDWVVCRIKMDARAEKR